MNITLYSTPTCPFCQQVRTYLTQNNREFTDINVMSDQEKSLEMIHKTGQMGVPVTDIDGEIVIGFDKEKLDTLLNIT